MKRLIVLALFVAPLTARAEQTPSQAHVVAVELVDLAGGQATVQQIFTATRAQLVRALAPHTQKAPAEVEQIVDQVIMPSLRALAPAIQAISVKAYEDNFSVDEMKQLEAFYRSPIGKTLVAREPAISSQTFAASTALIRDEMQQVVATRSDELRKRGIDL
jgi:hypothetical protein